MKAAKKAQLIPERKRLISVFSNTRQGFLLIYRDGPAYGTMSQSCSFSTPTLGHQWHTTTFPARSTMSLFSTIPEDESDAKVGAVSSPWDILDSSILFDSQMLTYLIPLQAFNYPTNQWLKWSKWGGEWSCWLAVILIIVHGLDTRPISHVPV